MVYISVSARILLNAEALNMVESIGNFVRHRRAPIVVKTESGYILRYVPVISGESLAHAYQEVLAKIAVETGLPVCPLCREGIFIKHSDDEIMKKEPWYNKKMSGHELEKNIIRGCVVEDVGGFLYAGKPPVRRTSRFYAGYAVPAMDAITQSAVEAQFHVRYDPRTGEHSIYNVEVGSALYAMSFALDVDGIGYTSHEKRELAVSNDERVKRVEAAIKALSVMLLSNLFGAKRTRFNPSWRIISIAASVTHPVPLTVQPPHTPSYIAETLGVFEKAVETLGMGSTPITEKATLIYYPGSDEEPGRSARVETIKAANPADVFEKLLAKTMTLV